MTPEELSTFLFVVGNKLLGLKLAEVDRVLPAAQLLDPPQCTPGLAGFLNYRGRAIAVLNFRELLGLPAKALQASDRIVLARAWNAPIGFIVDEALGVHQSGPMQPYPAEFELLNANPANEGFVPLGERLIVIQNLQNFIASSRAGLAASLHGTGSSPMGEQAK